MSEFVIKKNIPIPTLRNQCPKYPWEQMEDGDCFDVPIPKGVDAEKVRKTVQGNGTSRSRANKLGFKVISRIITDESVIRFWVVMPKTSEVEAAVQKVIAKFGRRRGEWIIKLAKETGEPTPGKFLDLICKKDADYGYSLDGEALMELWQDIRTAAGFGGKS